MKTSTQLSRCCWVRKSHRTVREMFHVKRGIHRSSVLWIHKDRHLKCCKKKCAQQLTEAHSMHALFSVCSLRDDDVISNKKTYMKTETCILYSGVFWIFLLIIIKIDRYNFELYHFKVGPFFMRHSVEPYKLTQIKFGCTRKRQDKNV